MQRLKAPLITAVISLFVLSWYALGSGSSPEELLTVTFLDVGQGDATLIESPSGTQVLIDGGKPGSLIAPLSRALGFFDRDLDMVVATHPDMDHVGGLIDVLERYEIGTIVMTENVKETPAFNAFLDAVEAEGANIIYARRGQVYDLGLGPVGSTTLAVLFPDRDVSGMESNDSSIVSRLVYGESEYLLTGDSPIEVEEYLVDLGASTLRSDVLKAGHHGSRTSTAETFVSVVDPDVAIISVGKGNQYGHPHQEVMDRFAAHGVETKNTADEGDIVSESDGATLWFK